MPTRLLALLPLLTLLAGCNGDKPKLVAATGKVVYQGQPLTAGSLHFHPQAGAAYTKDGPSSQLQLDGSFTMKTFPFPEGGVAPGPYKVTLSPELANRLKKPKLADPATTPWSVTVPEAGLVGHTFEVP